MIIIRFQYTRNRSCSANENVSFFDCNVMQPVTGAAFVRSEGVKSTGRAIIIRDQAEFFTGILIRCPILSSFPLRILFTSMILSMLVR